MEKAKEKKIEKFKTEIYKKRFKKIKAYQLKEDSKINLPNGEILNGKTGDFYMCIDGIQDMILPAEKFKKLFIKQ